MNPSLSKLTHGGRNDHIGMKRTSLFKENEQETEWGIEK